MSSLREKIDQALNSKYWSWSYFDRERAPKTLLDALKEHLPHIEPQTWDKRFEFGGIFVNGYEAHHDCELSAPCRLEYYEPKTSIDEMIASFPVWDERYVIYHDEYIACVYKPKHLPSMPAREQRVYSLKNYLDKHFGLSVHMPSRLDFSVEGLVLVSLSPKGHAHMQQAFEQRRVKKSYVLHSHSTAPWPAASVISRILTSKEHAAVQETSLIEGLPSRTTFVKISDNLVIAHPITGRTHQIRVHAAESGIPITGDRFYGGAPDPTLRLLSYHASFQHPANGEEFSIGVPDELLPDWCDSDQLKEYNPSRLLNWN